MGLRTGREGRGGRDEIQEGGPGWVTNSSGNDGGGRDAGRGREEGRTMTENIRNKYAAAAAQKKKKNEEERGGQM